MSSLTWDNIGGLDDAKAELIEAIELPHKHKAIFDHYRKRPTKGILLYGPPGCGKTLLGKVAASSLANMHRGNGADTAFTYVKATTLCEKHVGEGEKKIAKLFDDARQHKERHGYPAVIFLDEADAILSDRGSERAKNIEQMYVPAFLTEMDGMEESSAIVILATNRSDSLDPAIVRDGRIDRKIRVNRPTRDSALQIFSLKLSGVPLPSGCRQSDYAKSAVISMYSAKRTLYVVETTEGNRPFTLAHTVNGAMIAGAVGYGVSLAIRRDISEGALTALLKEELLKGVERVDRQSRDLNHREVLSEFVEPFRDKVLAIRKVIPGRVAATALAA